MSAFIDKIKNLIIKNKTLILEMIKFVIVGGVNTLMGGILLPHLFQLIVNTTNIVLFDVITIDLPVIYGFLVWFTAAYFLQIKFVFKCNFEWKRFLLYPLTQIPNLLLNVALLFLFKDVLQITIWDNLIARVLAAGCALPIMFILVRLVVKPLQKKNKGDLENEQN